MSNITSALSPSLAGVLKLVASREDAISGLRALAHETTAREGKRLLQLADQLERGELPALVAGEKSTSGWVSESSPVSRLARFAILERQRSKTRSRLAAVCALGGLYLLSSIVVSVFLLSTAAPFSALFLTETGLTDQTPGEIAQTIDFFRGAYGTAGVLVVILGALLLVRFSWRSPMSAL